MAPLSAKPELPRALVGELDVAREILAHGRAKWRASRVQASSSCLGSRLSAMILVSASMSLQLSGPLGQYLPLPYVPSMPAAMRVSSSLSLGSEGVARVSEAFSSLILRAVTGSSVEAVEARGLLGVIDRGVDGALVDLGGDGLGVVGDVGVFDPVGAAGVDIEGEEFLLGVVGEFAGLVGRGLRARRRRRARPHRTGEGCAGSIFMDIHGMRTLRGEWTAVLRFEGQT